MKPQYTSKFYTGDYDDRQKAANRDGAQIYIEQHFNGGSATANYALCNVGTNAGSVSKAFAAAYVRRIAESFGVPLANNDFATNGVSIGGYKRRGNANLVLTKCPAVLLEPLFVSNPKFAALVKTEAGQEKLARAITDTIREFFPDGARVAFSIGHLGKETNPKDRGVPVHNGGTEAEFAEIVLTRAAEILKQS